MAKKGVIIFDGEDKFINPKKALYNKHRGESKNIETFKSAMADDVAMTRAQRDMQSTSMQLPDGSGGSGGGAYGGESMVAPLGETLSSGLGGPGGGSSDSVVGPIYELPSRLGGPGGSPSGIGEEAPVYESETQYAPAPSPTMRDDDYIDKTKRDDIIYRDIGDNSRPGSGGDKQYLPDEPDEIKCPDGYFKSTFTGLCVPIPTEYIDPYITTQPIKYDGPPVDVIVTPDPLGGGGSNAGKDDTEIPPIPCPSGFMYSRNTGACIPIPSNVEDPCKNPPSTPLLPNHEWAKIGPCSWFMRLMVEPPTCPEGYFKDSNGECIKIDPLLDEPLPDPCFNPPTNIPLLPGYQWVKTGACSWEMKLLQQQTDEKDNILPILGQPPTSSGGGGGGGGSPFPEEPAPVIAKRKKNYFWWYVGGALALYLFIKRKK